ncbi:Major Facilitator Superfamily [Cryptosporidium felis]|nr:Major Facilitator Superfamily [Cryptosporidium felis]
MGDAEIERPRSYRRGSLESGEVHKEPSGSSPGVYREMFGTGENPTVIPFKSIIKNPKIYFPLIAFTATITAGHIQNPDASRELFFKSGGFSFSPEKIESGEALFTINNVMSVANGATFIGHMFAGFIIDHFGLLPCAMIGHFLSVIGYLLMFFLHFSSFAYYIAGISFGLSVSCTFASRSRFMQMFPKVKNTVGMLLTIGMDFALLLPIFQDKVSVYIGGHRVVALVMIAIQLVILVHHFFIFPTGKLPERMGYQNSELSCGLEQETTELLPNNEEPSQNGIEPYGNYTCVRKIFSLPFLAFFVYILFFALSRIHYQLFFRGTCQMNISSQSSAIKAAELGNLAYSLASCFSLIWGYIVDRNGLIITMQYQAALIVGSYFCLGFKSLNNIVPHIMSSILAGLYTCFANSLTYSFVAGVFGYEDFGIVQGVAALSAFISFMSINYWQSFLNSILKKQYNHVNLDNVLKMDYNPANNWIMYVAAAIFVILSVLRITYNRKK